MNRILKLAFAGMSLCISVGLTTLALALPSLAHAGTYPVVSRDYPWSSDHLTVEIPAEVHFRPGASWHLTIRAPERVLDELVVKDGRIKARSTGCFSLVPFCIGFGTHLDHSVDVELTGPALRSITLDGSGTVDLDGLRQDRLAMTINGNAMVRGTGRVGTVEVQINGAGNIQLAQLNETRAHVIIHGSGTVDIAPSDSVSVRIDGAGTVRLHSNPSQVSSHIFGAGEVLKVPPSRPAVAHPAG